MRPHKILKILSLMIGFMAIILLGLSAFVLSDISNQNAFGFSQEWTIVQLAYIFVAVYIFISLFTIFRER